MIQVDMTAEMRTTVGKGMARSLRRDGLTPAIMYGPGMEPVALKLETESFVKALMKIIHQNAVISLNIKGHEEEGRRHVMLKEIQTDPLKDTLVHADFYEISLEKPLTLTVPVKYVGKAKGVDMGGELQTHVTKVTLSGLALDIPDFVEIDISELGLGESLKCGDLNIPAQVKLLEAADKLCAAVVEVSVKAEGEAAEGDKGKGTAKK